MVPSGGMAASGYGFYKMNLLAPFNGAGWSSVGLLASQAAGEYEGFNYFGLGGLVLCAMALVVRLMPGSRTGQARRLWPLVAVALVLTLAAITHHVGVGAWQTTLPLPGWLDRKLSHSSIQSTGRLFWVAYYALFLWGFFSLARAWPARRLVAVLAALVLLQWVDLQPGLLQLRHTMINRAQVDDAAHLQGPFWDTASQRYTRLRLVPTRILAPGWEVLARYANEHHMDTDAVQVARANWKLFNRQREEQLRRIAGGTPEEQTLYVLDDSEVPQAVQSARPQDALFRLDGWNVLAPGWNATLPAGAINLKATP